jgi:uncharacterized coiled-coil protein SlyX
MEQDIIKLQEMMAYQQEEIGRLSEELYVQQKEILRLTRLCEGLKTQLEHVSATAAAADQGVEPPPPHY